VSSRDDDDDPQLKSLRAVWLSMPDEESSERGLAELMAAARVKAEQMTQPSLWQRIAALLRRPPVLALATVLVLIGGAVFIGQRRDAMEAEAPPTARAREQQPVVSSGSSAALSANQGEAKTTGGAAAPVVAPEVAAEPEPEDPADTKAPPARRPQRRPAASVTKDPPRVEPAGGEKTASEARQEEAKPKLDDAPSRGVSSGAGFGVDKNSAADSLVADPAREEDGPAKEEDGPAAAPKGNASAPPPRSPAPLASRASQYLAQAKSAAARGDCAAVRTMMKRVASENAESYRKAVASDAAIRKCMAAQ
jgi:hypothetical protein